MSFYIDGFLLAVPKANLEKYREMSQNASAVWKKHGALDYKESVGDDLNVEGMLSFNTAANTSEDEVTIFAYIVYNSREHRDEVNAKVMEDPVLQGICNPENSPFDVKRMFYGGFKGIVSA